MTPAELQAIGALLSPLLGALERIGWAQRHLHPPAAPALAEALGPCLTEVGAPLAALRERAWPADLGFLRDRLADVAQRTVDLVATFVEAARSPGDVMGLYRAIRRFAAVQEALYPLAPALSPVSRWFLEPERRGDDALVARLLEAAPREDGMRVGILHAGNERGTRGGFSLYVPELADGRAPRGPYRAMGAWPCSAPPRRGSSSADVWPLPEFPRKERRNRGPSGGPRAGRPRGNPCCRPLPSSQPLTTGGRYPRGGSVMRT